MSITLNRIAHTLTDDELQYMGGDIDIQSLHNLARYAGYSSLNTAINDNGWWNLYLFEISNQLNINFQSNGN